jgi:hypothetical protein
VQHAVLVRELHRARDGEQQCQALVGVGVASRVFRFGQRAALHQRHHHERLALVHAGARHMHDVAVLEGALQLGLLAK